MCLAKTYVKGAENNELFLENVALVEVVEGKLRVRTIFREEKEIEANIKEIDFLNSSIILERHG